MRLGAGSVGTTTRLIQHVATYASIDLEQFAVGRVVLVVAQAVYIVFVLRPQDWTCEALLRLGFDGLQLNNYKSR